MNKIISLFSKKKKESLDNKNNVIAGSSISTASYSSTNQTSNTNVRLIILIIFRLQNKRKVLVNQSIRVKQMM